MQKHFIGREALAKQFASAFIDYWHSFSLVGLDDASNRRYFRVIDGQSQSFILMDAPPEVENAEQFVKMAQLFAKQGLKVPEIFAHDANNGFVLMQDFADRWLYYELIKSPQSMMAKALDLLQNWRQKTASLQAYLPDYAREKLLSEMALFQEWFLPFVMHEKPSQTLNKALINEQQRMADAILLQPKVCVHRDFHSRNLMWLNNDSIGIIDFQDALWGPASYDLVSLTRDCYIRYQQSQVNQWEREFAESLFPEIDSAQWLNYCEQTALQRHLKVLGLFVRLAQQAGKSRYLHDLPLVHGYSLAEARTINQSICPIPSILECLEQSSEMLSTTKQDVV